MTKLGTKSVRNDQTGYEMTELKIKVGTKWPKWYEMTWVRNDRLPYTLAYTNVRYSVSYVISNKLRLKQHNNYTWLWLSIASNTKKSDLMKNEHYDYDPGLETLTLTGCAQLTIHVWWIKFVKEMLLISIFIIGIQSIINVCNNPIVNFLLVYYNDMGRILTVYQCPLHPIGHVSS